MVRKILYYLLMIVMQNKYANEFIGKKITFCTGKMLINGVLITKGEGGVSRCFAIAHPIDCTILSSAATRCWHHCRIGQSRVVDHC